MKIAIHNGKLWNKNWREYCIQKDIPFLEVDCLDNYIIQTLKKNEITHLLWHFTHNSPPDILTARNILFAASKIGIKTFPDYNTCWHFDDKVSQKYLLEALGAPTVPTYTFYSKKDALSWLKNKAEYPVVTKLRRGAGSYNVKLLSNYRKAKIFVEDMFNRGKKPSPGYLSDGKNKLKVAKNLKGILTRLKKAPGFFQMVRNGKMFPKEKGYVYFQDFIPGNTYDLRIAVVDNYIWAFKRKVRANDFRASGSGVIEYENIDVPLELVRNTHLLSKKLGAQSMAYDYVKNHDDQYLLVEMSYGYSEQAIFNSKGYWDDSYNFVEKKVRPDLIILEKFLKK